MTPVQAPTICTVSTVTSQCPERLLSATGTWVHVTGPALTPSRSGYTWSCQGSTRVVDSPSRGCDFLPCLCSLSLICCLDFLQCASAVPLDEFSKIAEVNEYEVSAFEKYTRMLVIFASNHFFHAGMGKIHWPILLYNVSDKYYFIYSVSLLSSTHVRLCFSLLWSFTQACIF